MERSVAIKKLGQLLGKKLGYRVAANAPTKEEREAARAELVLARAEHNRLKDQREARYQAILAADPEYQSIKAACSKARERSGKLSGITCHYKITVGTSEGMFFMVKAEGDSWEEIIDKLTKKQKAA